MKKIIITLVVMTFGLTLVLTGCGNNKQDNQNEAGKNSTESANSSSVKDGIKELLASTQDLKNAIQDGDTDKVKKIGSSLEDIWASFEDEVKPVYPDSYEEIEKYLDPAIAGSNVTPIDKDTLLPLVDSLMKATQDLSAKVEK